MNEKSPGARAVEAFLIEDVFLVASECRVARDHIPQSLVPEILFGYKFHVDPEALVQERKLSTNADVESFFILRYFMKAEVRVLRPGVQATSPDTLADANTLAELKFTVATDYRGPKELVRDQAVISAFSRNAHFHAWPYVREEVHAMCGRLRIPRITLPMLKPNQLGMAANVQAFQTSVADGQLEVTGQAPPVGPATVKM